MKFRNSIQMSFLFCGVSIDFLKFSKRGTQRCGVSIDFENVRRLTLKNTHYRIFLTFT